jgi:hypothetical protein
VSLCSGASRERIQERTIPSSCLEIGLRDGRQKEWRGTLEKKASDAGQQAARSILNARYDRTAA